MEQSKTFVLIHGAFHGGWCWQEVAELLRKNGHRVFTPTLTGLGERSHLMSASIGWDTFITDITQVLKFEELSDVILVGHSFSGGTITGVADRMPEALSHLVYFDAMVLQNGQAPFDTAPKGLVEGYRVKAESSGGISLPPNPPHYFGITKPDQVAKLMRLLTPHPFNTYFDSLVLENPVGNGLPTTYVACTEPLIPATATSRDYAQARKDWQYVEIDEPHSAMITAPEKVAALLEGVLL